MAAILRHKLSELSAVPAEEDLAGRAGYRVSLGQDGCSQPQLLRYVLVDVLGCDDLGQSDKTAWEVIFGFRKAACVVAFRKFGLRLEVYPPTDINENARNELIRDLQEQLVSAERKHSALIRA